MNTIHKYPAPINDELTIEMPYLAKVLCVQTQGDSDLPQIWAAVDTSGPMVARKFTWRSIGHCDISGLSQYIGTVQVYGNLVFHLFEVV